MHKIILQGYLGPKKDIQVLLQDFMTRTEIKVLFKFKYSFLDLLIFLFFACRAMGGGGERMCVSERRERERGGRGVRVRMMAKFNIQDERHNVTNIYQVHVHVYVLL